VRGIDRRNPLRAAAAALAGLAAVSGARRVIRAAGADVVLGGGGFVAGPAGLAAILSRVPLLLTEADSRLGLANRLLAPAARRVCLSFPIAGREGPRYLLTGRAVPAAVLGADRAAARRRFGLAAEEPCLLVMGGSQGARSINEAAIAAFAERPGRAFSVIHLSGERDFEQLSGRLRRAPHGARYTLLASEPDLGEVLAACDLALARAGGSVFELAAARRPAILVPYPRATAAHQAVNAAWMAAGGAALVIADSELSAPRLVEAVGALFGDPERLAQMGAAAGAVARPDAAQRIADQVLAAAR
jgi:UDP-N-acetylglucosamine--N-acetylmuramyl-(pentapeptide) pyrophosphoryl-undecaprenol N-acetylglucosamine transferase